MKWVLLMVGLIIGLSGTGILTAEEQASGQRILRSNIAKAKSLYTVMTSYAANHGGVFPPDRVALYGMVFKMRWEENDIRGSGADGEYWDFVSVRGVTKNDRGSAVLAYSPIEAGEPRVVLHVSGLVKTMSNKELDLALAEAKR